MNNKQNLCIHLCWRIPLKLFRAHIIWIKNLMKFILRRVTPVKCAIAPGIDVRSYLKIYKTPSAMYLHTLVVHLTHHPSFFISLLKPKKVIKFYDFKTTTTKIMMELVEINSNKPCTPVIARKKLSSLRYDVNIQRYRWTASNSLTSTCIRNLGKQ